MVLFMHMQVIMLSKGAAKQKAAQGNAARTNDTTTTSDGYIFFGAQFTMNSMHIFFCWSFQRFSHLI